MNSYAVMQLYIYRRKEFFYNTVCKQWDSQILVLCWTGDVVDEQTAQEETEDKLKQCIDNLMDKRWPIYLHKVLQAE